MNTLTDSDFAEIQQKFDEDEKKSKWKSNIITYYTLQTKALSELKSLYEKLGDEQFFNLASSAIISDSGSCNPHDLFSKLPNKILQDEYKLELDELNRKFLSKALVRHDYDSLPIHIMGFLASSICTDNISKEFIDSIRLNPDSTLFSKEYVESYAESLKNGSWHTNNKPYIEIIQEGINKADELVLEKRTWSAIHLYEKVIEMIQKDKTTALFIIHNIIFKIILCHIANRNSVEVDDKLKRFTNDEYEYIKLKESKQYAYLCVANSELKKPFKRDITLRDEFLTQTKEYKDNELDPIIIHLLIRCKDSILRFNK